MENPVNAYEFSEEDIAANQAANTSDDQTTTPEIAEVVEPPKLAQITEDQYQDLLKTATAIDEIKADHKKQLDTAFGKIGGIQQLVTQLQSSTQAGKPVELTDEDVADMTAEYPELGALQLKVLQKVVGKLRGTGSIDPAMVDQRVQERINPEIEKIKDEVRREYANKFTDFELKSYHRDWNAVVKSPEFKTWMDKLPEAERTTLMNSEDASVVAQTIDKFKASTKPVKAPIKEISSRQKQLAAAAATPRSTGGHAAAGSSPEDEMTSGYSG